MHITDNAERDSRYYDEIYAAGYNTTSYQPLYQLVLEGIHRIEAPRVLEIGCGVGDLGQMIIEEGIPYRGFDFSEEAVRCSQRLCPQGDFRVGDAYDPESYHPHDYNIAVALEVLEHVDDLRIIANLPSGVNLFASVPNYNDSAHLRIYEDQNRDIIERFRPYMNVVNIVPMIGTNDTGEKRTIYTFHGIRKPRQKVATEKRRITITNSTAATDNPPDAKVGRNDPCPCGSGRKYKTCCMP